MAPEYISRLADIYAADAASWSINNRDPVVGSFDKHNVWSDYQDFLFRGVETEGKVALDYGCGVARSIVLFRNRFARIDGLDVSEAVLEKARQWLAHNEMEVPTLYLSTTLGSELPGEYYDVIFSTICMQHISVYSARFSILVNMFRSLKPGGFICIQMGYDLDEAVFLPYNTEVDSRQGTKDMTVTDPSQLAADLSEIGYQDFSYDLRPCGPGDAHMNWIYFRAQKP